MVQELRMVVTFFNVVKKKIKRMVFVAHENYMKFKFQSL